MRHEYIALPETSLFVSRDVRIFTVRLATLVGLNEAIMLQQLWYWLERSRNVRDGRRWVYNTYEDWRAQMPWWSERTVQRTLLGLERAGLVLTGRYNELRADRTKWYTIDFDRLIEFDRLAPPTRQVGTMPSAQDGTMHGTNLAPAIPETTTETTREMLTGLSLEERLALADDPARFLRDRSRRRPAGG